LRWVRPAAAVGEFGPEFAGLVVLAEFYEESDEMMAGLPQRQVVAGADVTGDRFDHAASSGGGCRPRR
jgi:hypothetical protein